MRHYLNIISLLFILVAVTSCRDYTPYSQSQDSNNSDEYYVKYIVSSYYPYIFSDVTYADVNGTGSMMNYQTRNWSVTIGPVKKGFRAYVKNAGGTATDEIEISKNGNSFVLKSSGKNSASYTIE